LPTPGGIRSRLGREGITFHINYIGEGLGNPTGGVVQGTVYDGRLELCPISSTSGIRAAVSPTR
jgi:hypothetical protein